MASTGTSFVAVAAPVGSGEIAVALLAGGCLPQPALRGAAPHAVTRRPARVGRRPSSARSTARLALVVATCPASDATDALLPRLESSWPEVSAAAARHLGSLGCGAERSLPALRALSARGPRLSVRAAARAAIASIEAELSRDGG